MVAYGLGHGFIHHKKLTLYKTGFVKGWWTVHDSCIIKTSVDNILEQREADYIAVLLILRKHLILLIKKLSGLKWEK
jgi:hypothetical protein